MIENNDFENYNDANTGFEKQKSPGSTGRSKSRTSSKSGSLASARSTRAAINSQIKSERASPLSDQLKADFLAEVRGALKGLLGHKVEALDNKHKQTQRKKQAAKLTQDSGGGGANTIQHPELAPMQGIAPDNLITPESESPESGNAQKAELNLKHTHKAKLKAEQARIEKRRKLKQDMKLRERRTHQPPRFTPNT